MVELLLHPALLALPVALLLVMLVPDIFEKYRITQLSEEVLGPDDRIEYHDLDNDGNSEWFFTGKNDSAASFVTVFNSAGVIDQWNMQGRFSNSHERCIVGDADNDGFFEIYPLVVRNDSLFVCAIDIRKKSRFIFHERFVTLINGGSKQNFSIYSGNLTDLNSDGTREILFTVSAGFGLIPRKIFAVDLAKDTIYQSPQLGANIGEAFYKDFDGDGVDEIVVNTIATGNYRNSGEILHDHSAYIMAFNHHLEFCFKPIEFPGDYSICHNLPYAEKGNYYIATYFQPTSTENVHMPQVQLRDIRGNLIRKRLISEWADAKDCNLTVLTQSNGDNTMVLIIPEKEISVLNAELKDIATVSVLTKKNGAVYNFDADNDGDEELILYASKPGEFYLFRNDLSHKATFTVAPQNGGVYFLKILKGNGQSAFLMQNGNFIHTFAYGFNPQFYWQYPVYAGIYLAVLIFILVIGSLQRIQLKKKYETEKRMTELQLLSLHNQMDPHFTFNVLNTIGSVILQNKSDESYELLMKFSKMIRSTLHSSERISRPLKDETEFVQNYLELQQTRYQELFRFNLEIAPSIDLSQPVPKMVLHTYVENALKHGLVPRKRGGELLISVVKREKHLEISVRDNGVGRRQATLNGSTSTGVGLSIISQYYKVLNRKNLSPITEEFIDLFDDQGNAAGTRVVVRIPDGFVFPGSPVDN